MSGTRKGCQHYERYVQTRKGKDMLYVIIADGTFDQVCETEKSRDKEVRDLKRMGCKVRVQTVKSWPEANAIEDRMAGR